MEQATPVPGRQPTERARTVLGLALGDLAWLAGKGRRDVERRAVEVWTGLVKDYPENRSHRSNLSYALYRQSFPLLSAYDTDAVAPLVRQSESALRPALDDSPREHADITGLNHLAKFHREFGFTLLCKKRHADALDQFDRGVQVFQRVLNHEPMFWDGDVTMSRLHQYRATALEGLGRRDEAVAAWDQALEFAKFAMKHKGSRDITDICRAELAERFFHHGHYDRALKEAALLVDDSQVSAPIRFLLARTLAEAAWRLGEERRRPLPFIQKEQERLRAMALTALWSCQAAGLFEDPKRVQELKTWAQFSVLRERADCQALLAEVESRKK
ncbi:MAG: hypothetical protein U0797_29600 [Gemmataceae bacterium]